MRRSVHRAQSGWWCLLVGQCDAANAHQSVFTCETARQQRASSAGTADMISKEVNRRCGVVLTALVEQLERACSHQKRRPLVGARARTVRQCCGGRNGAIGLWMLLCFLVDLMRGSKSRHRQAVRCSDSVLRARRPSDDHRLSRCDSGGCSICRESRACASSSIAICTVRIAKSALSAIGVPCARVGSRLEPWLPETTAAFRTENTAFGTRSACTSTACSRR